MEPLRVNEVMRFPFNLQTVLVAGQLRWMHREGSYVARIRRAMDRNLCFRYLFADVGLVGRPDFWVFEFEKGYVLRWSALWQIGLAKFR